MTGLPPNAEDLQKFLNDGSPDAYEKVVEKLLASPAFGEHWGQQWLDLVRYSDSEGFKIDRIRPDAVCNPTDILCTKTQHQITCTGL